MPNNESRVFLALDKMTLQEVREVPTPLIKCVAGGKATDLIDSNGAAVLDDLGFQYRFLDSKIHDIKATVVNRLMKYVGHADIITVHASASPAALRAAAETAQENNITAIAVTVPTDISERQCKKIYGAPPKIVVVRFAQKARRAGLSGIVCSAKEVSMVRRVWGNGLLVVTGVRSPGVSSHDQRRVGTPYQAMLDGADFLVSGRQIFDHRSPDDQIIEAERINDEVQRARMHLCI